MSRLRDLAEAATPGRWEATADGSEGYSVRGYRGGRRHAIALVGRGAWEDDKADALFIAACSPEVIVAYENLKDAAVRVAVLEYHPEMSQAENDELRRRADTFRAALALVETVTKDPSDA